MIELLAPDGAWRLVGTHLTSTMAPGSFSVPATPDSPREVMVFGWLPTGEGPGVWRSPAGMDVEVGELRAVAAWAGFDLLSDLETPYEIMREGVRLRVRKLGYSSSE